MTKYQVSYKNLVNPNYDCTCGFSQESLIFLEENNNPNNIIIYLVAGYFLKHNNRIKDVSDIKFTGRNFLTGYSQEEIKRKLENAKHLETIVTLNSNYEVISPESINNPRGIEKENGIYTIEEFLYSSEKSAFSRLKTKYYYATLNSLKEDNFTQSELADALCELSSKH